MEPDHPASKRILIPTNSALEELRGHTARGASGEFIFAHSKREIHVFVQLGRLAWAQDSSAPLGFVRAVQDRSGASVSDIRDALEAARVERRSIAETLTQWRLATWDDLRWAQQQQLVSALGALASGERSECIFLARDSSRASESQLLFTFDEIIVQVPPSALRTEATGTFRAAIATPVPPITRPSISASDVLVAVRGAVRVEVLRGHDVVDSAGCRVAHHNECLRLMDVLDDDASMIVAHSTEHSMIGVQLCEPEERVWLYLGHAVSLAAALAPFADRIAHSTASDKRFTERPLNDPRWSVGSRPHAKFDAIFAHSEVLAAFVFNDQCLTLFGEGRECLSPDDARAIVERRCPLLQRTSAIHLSSPPSAHIPKTSAYRIATREQLCWCLGATISRGSHRESVWLLTHPGAGLAIGWACLAAMLRTIERR